MIGVAWSFLKNGSFNLYPDKGVPIPAKQKPRLIVTILTAANNVIAMNQWRGFQLRLCDWSGLVAAVAGLKR